LTKLGLNDITVFDPDIVENQNRANQLYGSSDIGVQKVQSLQYNIEKLSNIVINPIDYKFPLESPFDESPGVELYRKKCIVIVTVDSMKSRIKIFEWLKEHWMSVNFFIDARTGGEVGRVFAFNPMIPSNMDEYAKTLHSDTPDSGMNEEVRRSSEVKCTARSIVDVSVTVAARITNTVRKYLTHKEYPFETDIDLRNDIWIVNK
jgi:molybdopterin/thiamine biosynthesis adenylyltransferase